MRSIKPQGNNALSSASRYLIATAVLAAAGSVNAQTSVYGLIDVCYGKSLYSDLSGVKADIHSGGDNGSSECNSTTRVGVKSSMDVASGLKVNVRLETGGITSDGRVTYDAISNSSGPFFNRQAWVGLSGSFGEVRVGRQDSVPFQVMTAFDFNGASNGVSAGAYTGIAAWAKGRQSRSIQYISPTVGGFVGQVGLRPKGNGQDGNKDVLSAAARFGSGPIVVGATVQTKSDSSGRDFYALAGSYDLGVAKVMASWADGGKVADGGQGKGYMLGVTVPVGSVNFGAHYANNTDSLVRIKAAEFFVNKELLKNTYGYIEGGRWKSDASGVKASGYGLGVIYVF